MTAWVPPQPSPYNPSVVMHLKKKWVLFNRSLMQALLNQNGTPRRKGTVRTTRCVSNDILELGAQALQLGKIKIHLAVCPHQIVNTEPPTSRTYTRNNHKIVGKKKKKKSSELE